MPGITKEWKFIENGPEIKYRMKIFGFAKKLRTWAPGREVWSQTFQVGDSRFSLEIFPNGSEKKNKGNISVGLRNRNDWDVSAEMNFRIGGIDGKNVERNGFLIPANCSHLWPKVCLHRELADNSLTDDGCIILTAYISVTVEEVTARRNTTDLLEESKEEVGDLKSEVADIKADIKTLISKTENGRKDIKKILPETKCEIESLKSEMCDLKNQMKSLVSKLEDMGKHAKGVSKIPCPECPVCFEEMKPPVRIIQCKSGHLICKDCQSKPEVVCCPSCKQQFTGRAFGMENYLRTIIG